MRGVNAQSSFPRLFCVELLFVADSSVGFANEKDTSSRYSYVMFEKVTFYLPRVNETTSKGLASNFLSSRRITRLESTPEMYLQLRARLKIFLDRRFPNDIILSLYELFRCECVGCERDLRPMGKPGHPPPAAGGSCLQISPSFSPHKVLRDSTYCWKIDPDRFSLQPRASST